MESRYESIQEAMRQGGLGGGALTFASLAALGSQGEQRSSSSSSSSLARGSGGSSSSSGAAAPLAALQREEVGVTQPSVSQRADDLKARVSRSMAELTLLLEQVPGSSE